MDSYNLSIVITVSCLSYFGKSPDAKQRFWFAFYYPILTQGLHILEKYLNVQECLEKALKVKSVSKSTW